MDVTDADYNRCTVAIAVVEDDDRFLIGQRGPNVALAGYWEFPGGKVAPGETLQQAAARECWEETGIAVQVLDRYVPYVHTYQHARVELNFFRCQVLSAETSPKPPFRWVPRATLPSYRFPAGNAPLLRVLLSGREV
jgi:mutator protein MutT